MVLPRSLDGSNELPIILPHSMLAIIGRNIANQPRGPRFANFTRKTTEPRRLHRLVTWPKSPLIFCLWALDRRSREAIVRTNR